MFWDSGGSPVRQEKLVIHLGSVAARIKDRKCMTIGGLQSHLSSAGWFKVLLLPELLTRKLSPRKMTLPFSPFSMMMKMSLSFKMPKLSI
ncbi:hypothetical protein Tco_0657206 [Tanacetum coccineum]|uniref:Uncharacterized protein n=1 Tax=Tanacetum coccineum TaxID=301880 RepID=A0ABQ4XBJ2_9ASTR